MLLIVAKAKIAMTQMNITVNIRLMSLFLGFLDTKHKPAAMVQVGRNILSIKKPSGPSVVYRVLSSTAPRDKAMSVESKSVALAMIAATPSR
jgi:hypothetical protein